MRPTDASTAGAPSINSFSRPWWLRRHDRHARHDSPMASAADRRQVDVREGAGFSSIRYATAACRWSLHQPANAINMNRSVAPSIAEGVYTINIDRQSKPKRRLRNGTLRGALRVHPHKHCADYPPQKDRRCARRATAVSIVWRRGNDRYWRFLLSWAICLRLRSS
jgi:hypothetical protein